MTQDPVTPPARRTALTVSLLFLSAAVVLLGYAVRQGEPLTVPLIAVVILGLLVLQNLRARAH